MLYLPRKENQRITFSVKFSFSNVHPYILSPLVPSNAAMSPPWIMYTGTTLWNILPFKWSGFPDIPIPFSPVQSARKFSAVFGTMSLNNSIMIRPAVKVTRIVFLKATNKLLLCNTGNTVQSCKTLLGRQLLPLTLYTCHFFLSY